MYRFSVLVYVVYITVVLTSTTAVATEDAVHVKTTNASAVLPIKSASGAEKTSNWTLPSSNATKQPENQHMAKPLGEQEIMTEGGLIKPSSNSISTLAENGSKKAASKIVPRKGATSPENITIIVTQKPKPAADLPNEDKEPKVKTEEKVETIGATVLNGTSTTASPNMPSSGKLDQIGEKVNSNVTKKVSSTTAAPRKHKPTKTVGDSEDDDKPIHSLVSDGKQKKIDYFVPVVVSVITLPIIGVILCILYQRGRDCWDKRHYRRMDFLIDGMYNE